MQYVQIFLLLLGAAQISAKMGSRVKESSIDYVPAWGGNASAHAPYLCSMYDASGKFVQCDAIIYGRDIIISTAECFSERQAKQIRCGDRQLNHGQLYQIKSVKMNDKYNGQKKDGLTEHNIAVGRTDKKIKTGKFVKAVKISGVMPKPGQKGNVNGWGDPKAPYNVNPTTEKVIPVKIFEQSVCNDKYKSMKMKLYGKKICGAYRLGGRDADFRDLSACLEIQGKCVGLSQMDGGYKHDRLPGIYEGFNEKELKQMIKELKKMKK